MGGLIVTCGFKVLNSLKNEDEKLWEELWKKTWQKEVFLNPKYAQLYNTKNQTAKCAIYDDEKTIILYVFIQRKIDIELDEYTYYDIITPYGYGGPCYSGIKCEYTEQKFNDLFKVWCRENKIISEFIRFTLFDDQLIYYPGKIENNNFNIICNLEKDEETIWKDFKHKVRTNVRKAISNGVTVRTDENGDSIEDFLEIYYHTMDRNNAKDFYYFSKDYFNSIIKNLKDNYIIVNVINDSEIISTELILISQETMYSFLGGTKSEYFNLRPNDLLKYEAILWGKKNGMKKYVLGGGYEVYDRLYDYKLSFEPKGVYSFKVGKRIFNKKIYNLITDKVLADKSEEEIERNYFPLYRC